ncbi:hypothetical protein B0H10DRAFT_477858 [Mycena sp. CBHHK59/15]|nr:hypothetical protein B0H10DRAFT_477858 [Mycena sp. CBHHK59/15]
MKRISSIPHVPEPPPHANGMERATMSRTGRKKNARFCSFGGAHQFVPVGSFLHIAWLLLALSLLPPACAVSFLLCYFPHVSLLHLGFLCSCSWSNPLYPRLSLLFDTAFSFASDHMTCVQSFLIRRSDCWLRRRLI